MWINLNKKPCFPSITDAVMKIDRNLIGARFTLHIKNVLENWLVEMEGKINKGCLKKKHECKHWEKIKVN